MKFPGHVGRIFMYKFEMQKYARFRAAVADRHIQVSPPPIESFFIGAPCEIYRTRIKSDE